MSVENPYNVSLDGSAPQSIYPYQPGYVDPNPAPLNAHQAPPARALRSMTPAPAATGPSGMSELDDADAAINQCANEFEHHVMGLQADGFSPLGLAKAISDFGNTPVAKGMDASVDKVTQAANGAEANAADALASLSADGDSAQEMRNTRFWDRSLRTLDAAAGDPGKLVTTARDLVFKATPAEVGVLRQELPAYLNSKNLPSNWLDDLVAQKIPAVGDAQRQSTLWKKAETIVKADRDQVRKRIATTATPEGYQKPRLIGKAAVR